MSEASLPLDKVLSEGLRPYRTVDYLTQGYMALVALMVLVFHGDRVPGWPYYVAAHLAAIAGVHSLILLQQRRGGRVLDCLRAFYPILLYTFLYTETHRLMHMFVPGFLDGHAIAADQALFGCQPSRVLMQRLPYWWVSEPLYLAYFSYYAMVLGVGLGLYASKRERFQRYVTVVSFVFYVCYFIFIVLPVLGPYDPAVIASHDGANALIDAQTVPAAVAAGPFYRLMAVVYHLAEPRGGGAFPSSHVAVAIATLCFTWTWLWRARWVHLVLVILLALATLYGGYHYGVDVIAGALTAALLVPAGGWLYERTRRLGEPDPAGPLTGGPDA
jgi:membrane-associated phospholipid phosphatase